MIWTPVGMSTSAVLMCSSGFSGASYGAETPVNSAGSAKSVSAHATATASSVDSGADRATPPAHGVRQADTRALTLDDARARLGVQALGVTLLDLLERRVDKDLEERDVALVVDLAREGAVGQVRRDEGRQGRRARRGDELGDL